MKKINICIAGGGSTFTPGIIVGLIKKMDTFPLNKIVLFDNDLERVTKMGKYVQIVLNEYFPNVEVTFTLDKKTAYTDMDFIFCQIRTGRYKMRELDEKIPLSMGIIGQETCGPGGFAYGLRSIKDMIEIVEDVRKYSNAWILNYTNPAAIVALALNERFPNDKKILNICDQPISLLMAYSRLLGDISYKDMVPEYFGLNHFGWFTRIKDKGGNDLTQRIKDAILKDGFAPADKEQRDPSWLDTYAIVKDLLIDFPEFLPNTYLQYYLYPEYKVKQLNPNYTRANEVMNGREKRVFNECDEVIKNNTIKGNKTFEQEMVKKDAHGEMIVEIAEAIYHNQKRHYIVMVKNDGIIPNLSNEMMVEVLCRLGKDGPIPYKVEPIGVFYKGLIEQQYAYEKLTIEAYFQESYTKALQALTLNRTVVDAKKARILLDKLIEANKDYWPKLK